MCAADRVLPRADLEQRASRAPDFAAESRALAALAQEMVNSPSTTLQKLSEAVLDLCRADSAGVSLLEPAGESEVFRWHAIAGKLAPYVGGAVPREAGSCGAVIERNEVLLFSQPEQRGMEPRIYESLLAPFSLDGKPVGTVWAIAHSPERRFDAEDARALVRLALFASAAHQMVRALEAANRQAQEQLLAAARMATWTWDAEADVITASESLHELYGLMPGANLRNSTNSFPLVYPEDLERHRAIVETAAREGGSWHSQFRIVRPRDGKVIWLEERALATRDPATGKMIMAGLVWDITERKQAEQALRASEQRRLLAVEAAAIGDWRFDCAAGTLELSRRAREMCGEGTGEAVTLDELDRLIHPDDRAAVRAAREAALDPAGGRYRVEHRFLFGDGEVRWFESLGRAFFEEREGRLRPTHILGVMIDITERKRAEQRLRESDRRKDEFLATLAHELRNPLAPIRNGLQILALSASGDESLRRTGQMMERQMSHLVRLVDDLLEVSRISRGKVELRKKRVLLNEVLAGAIESTRLQIETKHHELLIESEEPIALEGDPDRLAQVFSNLLSNAAKYTEAGGRIRVNARREGGDAVVTVEDTGCGIPGESLESVFEMFSQGHSQEAGGGLGIGLALVRQLVQMHGGSVTAHSEGAGRGSTFTVRLPSIDGEHADAQAGAAGSVPVSSPGRDARRILVVDDNADAANSLAMLLEIHGHAVRTVYDGPAALQEFQGFGPEIVLLDIGMPNMDGYEVARRIRSMPRGRSVRLFALTGWGQEEDKRRAMEAGFDEHLTKPVEAAHLDSLLKQTPALRSV